MRNSLIYHGGSVGRSRYSVSGSGGEDEKVKVSINDTVPDYLNNKISLVNLSGAIINPGADESMQITAQAPPHTLVSVNDSVPGYLHTDKLTAGTNITFTILNPGGDESIQIDSAGGTGQGPVLLQTNFQYNDSQTTTLEDRFIAWKVIAKHSAEIDGMGAFIHDTNGLKKVNLGIYNEVGVLLGSTGEIVLPDYFHEEWQANLISNVFIVVGTQYWLGIWGDSIDIGTEIGFSNLGALFPSRVHCIDESSEFSLPANISTLTPGVQQAAIWARGYHVED